VNSNQKSPFTYYRHFSYIDQNQDGLIDFRELNNVYKNQLEEFEVNFTFKIIKLI